MVEGPDRDDVEPSIGRLLAQALGGGLGCGVAALRVKGGVLGQCGGVGFDRTVLLARSNQQEPCLGGVGLQGVDHILGTVNVDPLGKPGVLRGRRDKGHRSQMDDGLGAGALDKGSNPG